MRANKNDERAFTSELIRLRDFSNTLRNDFHDKIINWIDANPLDDGTITEALTMVLPTKGCKYALAWHGGCSMCTLPTDNPLNPTDALLQSLPDRCLELFEKKGGSNRFRAVKFYTSGSFIDPWELPFEIRDEILRKFTNLVDEITIETRCEFVNEKHIEGILEIVPAKKLIVAIGQETTDDEINKRSINKGHTHKQFARAVEILQQYEVKVKGYILLKPIFISEQQAIDDAIQSARDMINLEVDIISINPSYIGKATLMDEMFKQKNYQPPWLWTVLRVTKQIKELAGNRRIFSDPVAAGSSRGPRNCGDCDSSFKEALKSFSSSQDSKVLDTLKCDCEQVYNAYLSIEHLKNGHGISNPYAL
ncbi:MAG: archaeosine biosynthesis radical SAM protein RaSEA [Candidatus Heimdallarchaeota archaeon]|nr:archaeosine biosynthesis radical SAM protein RaSEA [Candidatus Heimdallarchaeota archaeon]